MYILYTRCVLCSWNEICFFLLRNWQYTFFLLLYNDFLLGNKKGPIANGILVFNHYFFHFKHRKIECPWLLIFGNFQQERKNKLVRIQLKPIKYSCIYCVVLHWKAENLMFFSLKYLFEWFIDFRCAKIINFHVKFPSKIIFSWRFSSAIDLIFIDDFF